MDLGLFKLLSANFAKLKWKKKKKKREMSEKNAMGRREKLFFLNKLLRKLKSSFRKQ